MQLLVKLVCSQVVDYFSGLVSGVRSSHHFIIAHFIDMLSFARVDKWQYECAHYFRSTATVFRHAKLVPHGIVPCISLCFCSKPATNRWWFRDLIIQIKKLMHVSYLLPSIMFSLVAITMILTKPESLVMLTGYHCHKWGGVQQVGWWSVWGLLGVKQSSCSGVRVWRCLIPSSDCTRTLSLIPYAHKLNTVGRHRHIEQMQTHGRNGTYIRERMNKHREGTDT